MLWCNAFDAQFCTKSKSLKKFKEQLLSFCLFREQEINASKELRCTSIDSLEYHRKNLLCTKLFWEANKEIYGGEVKIFMHEDFVSTFVAQCVNTKSEA